ncbi:MAG: SRPBCC family protein [Actinobacteria bacterium]|nr:SRPBCC family protein [Actinomycetota bacterium]
MDITATLKTDLAADVLYPVLADLGTYPEWSGIVSRAVAVPSTLDADGHGAAWSIDLRGQVGPLRRSKRLRMERTESSEGRYVRFDRAEQDGRTHSAWVLTADLHAVGAGTELTMRLHYGGSLWVPMLDRILRDEIERSRPRLVEFASRR